MLALKNIYILPVVSNNDHCAGSFWFHRSLKNENIVKQLSASPLKCWTIFRNINLVNRAMMDGHEQSICTVVWYFIWHLVNEIFILGKRGDDSYYLTVWKSEWKTRNMMVSKMITTPPPLPHTPGFFSDISFPNQLEIFYFFNYFLFN